MNLLSTYIFVALRIIYKFLHFCFGEYISVFFFFLFLVLFCVANKVRRPICSHAHDIFRISENMPFQNVIRFLPMVERTQNIRIQWTMTPTAYFRSMFREMNPNAMLLTSLELPTNWDLELTMSFIELGIFGMRMTSKIHHSRSSDWMIREILCSFRGIEPNDANTRTSFYFQQKKRKKVDSILPVAASASDTLRYYCSR